MNYNRFYEIFELFQTTEQKVHVFSEFIENITRNQKLRDAVAFSEIIQIIEDPDIQQDIETLLKDIYTTTRRTRVKHLIGLIAKSYAPKTEDPWFHEISDKYALPNLQQISSTELFDAQ